MITPQNISIIDEILKTLFYEIEVINSNVIFVLHEDHNRFLSPLLQKKQRFTILYPKGNWCNRTDTINSQKAFNQFDITHCPSRCGQTYKRLTDVLYHIRKTPKMTAKVVHFNLKTTMKIHSVPSLVTTWPASQWQRKSRNYKGVTRNQKNR